jgi:hypothetical protein
MIYRTIGTLLSILLSAVTAAAAPKPAIFRAPPSCAPAQPVAIGEMPEIWGDRVVYSRQDVGVPGAWLQPGPRRIGVVDLASSVDFYPVFPSPNYTSDLLPVIAGDFIAFIRVQGAVTEVHVAQIVPPFIQVVVETRTAPLPGVPSVYRLVAGSEYDPVNPNDFVLSWSVVNFQGTEETRWCRLNDCLQSVVSTGLPAGANGAPGTGPNEIVTEASASVLYSGQGGEPGFVYAVKDPLSTQMSWHTTISGFTLPLTIPFPIGPTMPMLSTRWVGDYILFGAVAPPHREVFVSHPFLPAPQHLYRSQPPLGFGDSDLRMSQVASLEGLPMISFTRIDATSSSVMVTFFDPAGSALPTKVQPAWSNWSNCTRGRSSGNRVVMSCTNPAMPGVPLIFATKCQQ